MNLRSEIHAAVDEVAPPAPALPREVVAYVMSEGRRRPDRAARSQPRWTVGMRRVGSFVAAALVLVLMVTLVVGGRIWRDLDPLAPQPSIDRATLEKLRAHPLNFVVVQPGTECPGGPFTEPPQSAHTGPLLYGVGPVYAQGSGARLVTSWGTYFETTYIVDLSFSGLALIRARDLETNQPVVFARDPYSKTQGVPTGDVVGKDDVLGQTVQKYPELVLDANHQSPADQPGWWPGWGALQGLPKGSSGCIGFQADGPGFSENWVVSYVMP